MTMNFLLIFNLLTEAESDKISNGKDAEDGIPDVLITIAAKLRQQQYRLIKTSRYYKKCIKKLKSFIVKDKKDGMNENDSENSSRPEMSSSQGSSR